MYNSPSTIQKGANILYITFFAYLILLNFIYNLVFEIYTRFHNFVRFILKLLTDG